MSPRVLYRVERKNTGLFFDNIGGLRLRKAKEVLGDKVYMCLANSIDEAREWLDLCLMECPWVLDDEPEIVIRAYVHIGPCVSKVISPQDPKETIVRMEDLVALLNDEFRP